MTSDGRLANFGKESQPEPVIASISQEILAEMIGTTRSRGQLFHEQISPIGLHRLQRRRPGSSQLFVKCRSARLNRFNAIGIQVLRAWDPGS
jgi:hypothetical protein